MNHSHKFLTIIGLMACVLLAGCSTPKIVEQHHHHYQEADTMAVKAQVDRQLSSWHEEMTQFFQQKLDEYSASWSSSENQKETISELITETTDSLGRKVRQEQRTISRDISRELQQQEQRLTREYEARLRVAVDSVGSIFQQRFDSLAAHQTSAIDHQTSSTPSAIDHRPWYQRWWSAFQYIAIGIIIALALYFTRSWWKKLING